MPSDRVQTPSAGPAVPFFATKSEGRVVGSPLQMATRERARKLGEQPEPPQPARR